MITFSSICYNHVIVRHTINNDSDLFVVEFEMMFSISEDIDYSEQARTSFIW